MKIFASALLAAFGLLGIAAAEDLKPEPCVINLLNPCGLVAQPGTDHILIADSGQGRIMCFHMDDWGVDKAINKFGKDVYGKGPMYDIGPLGMCFVNKMLAVGGGDQVDGKEVVYFFDMPPHGKVVEASTAKYKAGPIGPSKESEKGEGNFYALAYANNAVYVTSNGDDTKGWILKCDVKDGKPGELKTFIDTKNKVNVDAPVGLTADDKGRLIVGQSGEVNVAGDSLLCIYDGKSGELVSSAKTGLNDLVALAFAPKSKKLYGVDFSWVDPKQGGLYRLEMSGEGKDATVKTTKLCSLDKPSAMCFGSDGALYVTEFGTAEEGSKDFPGRLVKIVGDF